ncbi:hypothetical protein BPSY_2218 [Bifidobacterium psychraerophilum]|uniref:Uncharacterized protein n=1 Tax=Bifidobacterium psychraerophilum TaxID=218140 RepID=A0A087CHI3_9BIFI|nr:hypothetical protein BPSY_2218 [Bifidobacterium psychraerophilum]
MQGISIGEGRGLRPLEDGAVRRCESRRVAMGSIFAVDAAAGFRFTEYFQKTPNICQGFDGLLDVVIKMQHRLMIGDANSSR